PPGRRPATPTSWPWPAGGRARRCWPGRAAANRPPRLPRRGPPAAPPMGAAPLRRELERLARLGRVELDRDRPGGAGDTPADDTPPAAAGGEALRPPPRGPAGAAPCARGP